MNIMYSLMAFISALVLVILLLYNRNLQNKDRVSRVLDNVLFSIILFTLMDFSWGLCACHVIPCGSKAIEVTSFIFHYGALFSSYIWYRYATVYLNFHRSLLYQHLVFLPFIAGMILLISTPFTGSIYYVDEALNYHAGPLRMSLFYVEIFYFILGIIITGISIKKATDTFARARFLTIILFFLIPSVFGVFQLFFPDIPFYSMGYMTAAVIIFTGNISIEREKRLSMISDFYRSESDEIYKALESLGKSFVSLHLFDLTQNKQHVVHSTSFIDACIQKEDGADLQIRKVMQGVVKEEYVKDMVKFVNLQTLPARMQGKNMISHEFLGKNEGWCMSVFIRVESDSSGKPLKVIHAVQNIDDMKKREFEYDNAIRQAYEDQNVIYAELLKMQSGGIVATDMNEEIIVINDTAAQFFNHKDASSVSGSFSDLAEGTLLEDAETFLSQYQKLKLKGGPTLTYYFSAVRSGNKLRYIRGDVKRIELKGGKVVMITTFVDITKDREMEQALRIMSEKDALTDLYNRGSGEKKTSLLLEEGISGMFCLLDANKFKAINDTYGHQVGDKALMAIAGSLQESFRDRDIIMRLGGDEFAIFATGITNRKNGEECIQRLFSHLETHTVYEMGDTPVTISLGACFTTQLDEATFDTLYSKADSVMYQCKTKPGNNFAFYEG